MLSKTFSTFTDAVTYLEIYRYAPKQQDFIFVEGTSFLSKDNYPEKCAECLEKRPNALFSEIAYIYSEDGTQFEVHFCGIALHPTPDMKSFIMDIPIKNNELHEVIQWSYEGEEDLTVLKKRASQLYDICKKIYNIDSIYGVFGPEKETTNSLLKDVEKAIRDILKKMED